MKPCQLRPSTGGQTSDRPDAGAPLDGAARRGAAPLDLRRSQNAKRRIRSVCRRVSPDLLAAAEAALGIIPGSASVPAARQARGPRANARLSRHHNQERAPGCGDRRPAPTGGAHRTTRRNARGNTRCSANFSGISCLERVNERLRVRSLTRSIGRSGRSLTRSIERSGRSVTRSLERSTVALHGARPEVIEPPGRRRS